MKTISKKVFDRIPQDYKGIWGAYNGEKPEWKGRRTAFLPGEGTNLSVEGVHFLVEDEYSHLPWLEKENACAGCCYRFPGGYIEVERVYRLSEDEAMQKGLYCLDRADYIQHAKWGEIHGGCVLPGGEIMEGK